MADINYALQANGGTATASSTLSGSYPATACNNGLRHTNNSWNNGGGWNSAADAPQWLQIEFPAPRSIKFVNVLTLSNAIQYNTDPAFTDSASADGVIDYDVEYWNGTAWIIVPNGSIRANAQVGQAIAFAPITFTKMRVNVLAARGGYARLVEVEAFGALPIVRLNWSASVDTVSGIAGYEIERSTDNAFTSPTIINVSDGLAVQYDDVDRALGVPLFYRIKGIGGSGVKSAASPTITITP